MTARLHSLEPALFELSARAKLRVSGDDRLRFLNGQLTNDVRKASSSAAIEACILTAKGKLEAHVFLTAEPEFFVLDADPGLRTSLQPRLERYIIADDVQIEDVSDRWSLFHILQTPAPPLPSKCRIILANRFARPGWDVWIDAGGRDELFRQLSGRFTFCDADCAEVYRIEQGIARWDRELTGDIIPTEANLEERTIDYEKGCYVGQEVISRIKMSGQTNKKLCGLASGNDWPMEPGMRLFPIGSEKKEVGWITSATRSERLGKQIALGYVKRGFISTGGKLDAVSPDKTIATVRLEMVDLPFDSMTTP
jgi:tRNA-modifying protein YgfZ